MAQLLLRMSETVGRPHYKAKGMPSKKYSILMALLLRRWYLLARSAAWTDLPLPGGPSSNTRGVCGAQLR